MKLNATAFANAAAAVAAIVYVACRLLVAAAPDFFMKVLNSWFHTVDFSKIAGGDGLGFGSFVLGLISIVVVAWVVDYLFVVIYNSLVKS